MPRDPLPTVLRLRRLANDEARRAVSDATARETLAQGAADRVEHEIARETALACSLAADDSAVEAFGAWLTGARQRAAATRETAERAGAETARARAALNIARAGLEAAEALAAGRLDAAAATQARREQHALDDLTRRKRE
jgi:hypothetical protein